MTDEPHLYVYIPPVNLGDTAERKIVAASCVPKFKMHKYNADPDAYAKKTFRLTTGEAEETVKCGILFAGGV